VKYNSCAYSFRSIIEYVYLVGYHETRRRVTFFWRTTR